MSDKSTIVALFSQKWKYFEKRKLVYLNNKLQAVCKK